MICAPEGATPLRGNWAEKLARHFLQKKGLTLLKQNYRCRRGEIDLIMRDQGAIVFVEVRYRSRGDFGTGAESVDRRKQRKLIAAAKYFLGSHSAIASAPCRFDVVALAGADGTPTLTWIPNAFEASW